VAAINTSSYLVANLQKGVSGVHRHIRDPVNEEPSG
jgi:hypothetical protein